MKIGIIGTGIYGISLALNIAKENEVIMWSENSELVKQFQKKHNLKPITEAIIPTNIKLTNSLAEAINDANLIIMATSTKYVRQICQQMKINYKPLIPICIASKGIENDTYCFLSDIIKTELKAKNIAVISGPTFAVDLINFEPCALSVASNNKKAFKILKEIFKNNKIKLRDNNDLYGTQLCGCIKNVIAIAAGILDGLGYSESTRAFLITESMHDIKELLFKMECNPKTIHSFAGIGDLILTAGSSKSRNYRFGKLLGECKNKKEIDTYLKNNTTEGYYTLLAIRGLTKNRKIKMPIINIIYDIVINGKDPNILVDFLLYKD